MTTKHQPLSDMLNTILCQDRAVILAWLERELATGLLPTEQALRAIVAVLGKDGVMDQTLEINRLQAHLEAYKACVAACRVFVPIRLTTPEGRYVGMERRAAYDALDAVDALEAS